MDPLLIAAATSGAMLLIGFLTASFVVERADVRDSLRRLEGYQIQDVRDQEMLAPISERVFAPVLAGLSGVAQRFTPQGYRERVAHKLVLAGNHKMLKFARQLGFKCYHDPGEADIVRLERRL